MKAIYLLLIVSLVGCLNTKEKIQCFTENENLLEQVAKVIDAFKTKDFKIILNTILSAYFSVKNNIKDCLNDEPNLKMTYCGHICHGYSDRACLERCEERVRQRRENEKDKRITTRFTSRVTTRRPIIIRKQNITQE